MVHVPTYEARRRNIQMENKKYMCRSFRLGFAVCVANVCECVCVRFVALTDLKLPYSVCAAAAAADSSYLQWGNKMRTMIHFDFGINTRAHDMNRMRTRAMEKHVVVVAVVGIFRTLIYC